MSNSSHCDFAFAIFCFCENCGKMRGVSRSRVVEHIQGSLEETSEREEYSKYIVCIVCIIYE